MQNSEIRTSITTLLFYNALYKRFTTESRIHNKQDTPLSLCLLFFIKFLFFHQMIALQKLKNAFYFI